jgi:hypothetical protein
MRQFTLLTALFAAMGVAYASSHHAAAAPAPVDHAPAPADGFVDVIAGAEDQTVLNPGTGGAGLSLADALTLERKASLWWEYARDVSSVVSRCGWAERSGSHLPASLLPRMTPSPPSHSTMLCTSLHPVVHRRVLCGRVRRLRRGRARREGRRVRRGRVVEDVADRRLLLIAARLGAGCLT